VNKTHYKYVLANDTDHNYVTSRDPGRLEQSLQGSGQSDGKERTMTQPIYAGEP